MVVFIAAYHYFRIFNNWEAAYHINPGGGYSPTGLPFNHAYRYIDWMLTVPLLVIELVLILGLSRKETGSLISKLAFAAFLMIILGYVGETDRASQSVFSQRGLWGTLSTIPFLYILVVLLGEIRASMRRSSAQVSILLRNTALLTLFAWGFYPIAYMAPFFGMTGAGAEMGLQVGYSVADIVAKCGYWPPDPCHRGASHRGRSRVSGAAGEICLFPSWLKKTNQRPSAAWCPNWSPPSPRAPTRKTCPPRKRAASPI